jgi:hypothetical protein
MKTAIGRAALVLALLSTYATPAIPADMVVVEARGVALRAGQILNDAAPLALRQGQHVTLISSNGSRLRLDGPYNRAPREDLERTNQAGVSGLGFLITQNEARPQPGTARAPDRVELPDPWLLDVSRAGNTCLRDGTAPIFWRPDSTSPAALVIMPTDRSWRAETAWPAGTDRLSMNPPAAIRAGATYLVSLDGKQVAVGVVSVPDVLSNDAMRASWMFEKGCLSQGDALLRQLEMPTRTEP